MNDGELRLQNGIGCNWGQHGRYQSSVAIKGVYPFRGGFVSEQMNQCSERAFLHKLNACLHSLRRGMV